MHGARLAQFAMFALTSVALAAGAPDFSGQWKLNAAKSTNLGMMAAVQQTVSITQSPAEMKLVEASDFQGQKSGRTLRYDLKGAPVMNEGGMGGQAETVAKWDGAQARRHLDHRRRGRRHQERAHRDARPGRGSAPR